MTVSFRNENTSVFMTNPTGDHLEIDPGFNRVADEIVPHCVMVEVGKIRQTTSFVDALLGVFDSNDSLLRRHHLSISQSFK